MDRDRDSDSDRTIATSFEVHVCVCERFNRVDKFKIQLTLAKAAEYTKIIYIDSIQITKAWFQGLASSHSWAKLVLDSTTCFFQ